MRFHVFLMLFCLSASVLAEGTTYHWKDERGIDHYSDRPPPQSIENAEARRFAAPSADRTLPYLIRKAAADFPVSMYVADTCGQPCADGRALLSARGVPFTEIRVASPEEVAALRARFDGNGIVPAIQIGRTSFSGFSAERWQQMLDEAGYPKDQRGLSR
ncbi:MAG: glutaredoxin family protein [Rhodocyclaceae bacterium]|nr:glutaredoxin family protein [Rhodocyclaceae bacterium]MCP5308778.1 glutaredoxin family protein [Zoogloeaceae bacterium]